jgi:hypothetical protein
MFLFNESSFDNLAAHFDYSSSIINNLQTDTHYSNNNKSFLFNSTMKISNIDQEEDNNNNIEYFELNSLNTHTCCDNLSLLTEKQFEFDNITDYDDEDNDVTTSLSADSFTEYSFISSTTTTTSPKVLPLVKKKRNYLSKSFRSSTNKKSIKINKYLKQSRSLVLNSIENNQLLNEFHFKHKHQQRAKYVNKRRRTSTTIIRQSNSAGNISNTISINNTNLNTINTKNNVNYKPSIKVEKLLNDTRGMRKYLIDYDCLMSNKTTTTTKTNSEQFNDSLLFEKFRSSFLNEYSVNNNNNNTTAQTYTNRCSSSGYLTSISDC